MKYQAKVFDLEDYKDLRTSNLGIFSDLLGRS